MGRVCVGGAHTCDGYCLESPCWQANQIAPPTPPARLRSLNPLAPPAPSPPSLQGGVWPCGRTVTDVGQEGGALEPSPGTAVDTLGLPPGRARQPHEPDTGDHGKGASERAHV